VTPSVLLYSHHGGGQPHSTSTNEKQHQHLPIHADGDAKQDTGHRVSRRTGDIIMVLTNITTFLFS
jgi:hypothetical protein